jgi:hypothetical protein
MKKFTRQNAPIADINLDFGAAAANVDVLHLASKQVNGRAGAYTAERQMRQAVGYSGLGLEAQQAALQRFAQTEGFEILDLFVEVESGQHDADKGPVLPKAPSPSSVSIPTRHAAYLRRSGGVGAADDKRAYAVSAASRQGPRRVAGRSA